MSFVLDDLEKPKELEALAKFSGESFDDYLLRIREFEKASGKRRKKVVKYVVDKAWDEYQRRKDSE